jgi:hypothetical protein
LNAPPLRQCHNSCARRRRLFPSHFRLPGRRCGFEAGLQVTERPPQPEELLQPWIALDGGRSRARNGAARAALCKNAPAYSAGARGCGRIRLLLRRLCVASGSGERSRKQECDDDARPQDGVAGPHHGVVTQVSPAKLNHHKPLRPGRFGGGAIGDVTGRGRVRMSEKRSGRKLECQ